MKEIGNDEEILKSFIEVFSLLYNILVWDIFSCVPERDCNLSTMVNFFGILPKKEVAGLILKEDFHLLMGTPVLDLFVIGSIIEAGWVQGSCRLGAEDHFDCPIERVVEIESYILFFQLWDMISLDELFQASKDLLQDRFIAYFEIPSVARLARFLTFAFSSEHLSDLKCLIQMFYEGIESTQCLWRYVEFQVSGGLVRVDD